MEAAKRIISEARSNISDNYALLSAAYMLKLSCTLVSVLLIYCVYICLQGVFGEAPDIIPAVSFCILALVSIIVSFPLRLGYKRMAVMLSKGYRINMGDLFYYYSQPPLMKGSVKVYCGLCVRVIVGVILAVCVERVVYFSVATLSMSFQNPDMDGIINSVYIVLIALVIIIFTLYMFRYIYVTYLAVENNCAHLNKCVNASVALAKNNRNKLFGIFAHFVHLIILSLLVFPLLYTMPLFSVVSASSANESIRCSSYTSREEVNLC